MENENLNMILERLEDSEEEVKASALSMLVEMIKQSQSDTLNFQFLSEKKEKMIEIGESLREDQKRKMYDIISAISIIGEDKDILSYRLKGNVVPLSEWGHLYVKKLMSCIVKSNSKEEKDRVAAVSDSCVDFLFKNNLEFEAIDFLLEIGRISRVVEYVDTHNYKRIILYLEEMKAFYPLDLSGIYKKMGDHTRYVTHNALDKEKIIKYARGIKDKNTRRQLLYMLARMDVYYESQDPEEREILSNGHVKGIIKEVVGVLEIDKKTIPQKRSKYEKGLHQASFSPITVTNGFMHMGLENDTIFFPKDDSTIPPLDYEAILNSDIPELVTVLGSVGCIEAWSPERVLELLQEHIFGDRSSKKTGALLALALASCKRHDERMTYVSLLLSNIEGCSTTDTTSLHIIPTLLGIQAMYSGSCEESLREPLLPFLYSQDLEVAFFTSFVLGSIFCGTGDDSLISLFMQMYIERDSDSPFFKLHILGLALLYYKRPDLDCLLLEVDSPYSRHGSILVRAFQHLASGDPLVVENILADSFTGETDALLESLAILACTLVGLGDDLVARIATSSLLLESPHLKSVLPLSYALLYTSNPQSSILDVLEKSLNSGDSNTVIPTIFSLGVIGAGTLCGRIQKVLDSQMAYFYKDPKASSVLKISQGLLSLGKGLMSLSPFFYDKTVLLPKNFIGLFATTLLFLEPSTSPILNNPYLFYLLVQAATPKYIYCPTKINIRVGNPVNTVGVVGDPRRISSMQTHSSPVVLGANERAEIDEETYTSYIEDVVLLK